MNFLGCFLSARFHVSVGRSKCNKTHTIRDSTGHDIKRDMTDRKDLLRNSKQFTSPPITVANFY